MLHVVSKVIHVHGLIMNESAFVTLLNGEDPVREILSETSETVEGHHDQLSVFGPMKKTGRKATWEKFPKLTAVVDNFIKQNSFSAHGRRRETSGTGTGVTLEQIRKHVLNEIPELKDISRNTVHRLMVPPRKRTVHARSFFSLVAARVPKTGRNDYRENREN